MKVDLTSSEVVSTSQHKERRFGVNQGAQMFKVLSSTLYPDKIRAIIRELSCNAWDAHMAAGKPDVPFEIHLPTIHEPWFAIKDEGTGLSDPDIYDLFCTYFGSNKTQSDKFIGALGLGSKSPFCYRNEHDEPPIVSVRSTFEGVTRLYNAFMDEKGEPTVQQMGEAVLTPSILNGIEIKFAVKQTDVWEFKNKARSALEFFVPRPRLNVELEINKQSYLLRTSRWGIRKGAASAGIRAVMGNIAYKVEHLDISRLNHVTKKISEMPLDIFFEIGELSFTASREELELDSRTVKALTAAYTKVHSEIIDTIREKIDKCENAWDARLCLFELTLPEGLGGFVNEAWKAGEFDGTYSKFELAKKSPSLCTLDWRHAALVGFSHNSRAATRARKEAIFNPQEPRLREMLAQGSLDPQVRRKDFEHFIEVKPEVHFVINDLEKRAESYIHYFLQGAAAREGHGKKNVFVFTRMAGSSSTIEEAIAEAKKMLEELGSPKYEMASALKARYEKFLVVQRSRSSYERTGRRPILELAGSISRYRHNEDGWSKAWKKSESQCDGTKFYITVERLRGTECGQENAFKFLNWVRMVRAAGMFGLDASTPVYGLRKNARLRKSPDWVELTGHIQHAIAAMMTPEREAELALMFCPFESAAGYEDVFKHAEELAEDSPFRQFAEALAKAKAPLPEPTKASAFKQVLDEAALKGYYKRGKVVDHNRLWMGVIHQYPLLAATNRQFNGRVSEASWRKAAIEYIQMMDRNRQESKEDKAMAAEAAQ